MLYRLYLDRARESAGEIDNEINSNARIGMEYAYEIYEIGERMRLMHFALYTIITTIERTN